MTPKWQPIETAPKDGTEVLVWVPGWNETEPGFIDTASWFQWPGDEGMFSGTRTHSGYREATHWMPLPAAPTTPRRPTAHDR